MDGETFSSFTSFVKVPLTDKLFYSRTFSWVAKQKKLSFNPSQSFLNIVREDYEALSRALDRSQIQESCAVRNVLRTRKLAKALINEKGGVNTTFLPQLIEYLREHLYSLGPDRQYDAKRQEHLLRCLISLEADKEILTLFNQISRPISNKWAEDMIRETLQLPKNRSLTDAHAKQAVLAAWFCYLRQNVGSCFATAPAGIVHDEQPVLFLKDMLELIATGRLKRIFEGVEYTVPMSPSWGNGDLKKPILIRKESGSIDPKIWYSPGLIKAFEVVGCLELADSTKQKIDKVEKWCKSFLQQEYSIPNQVVTAESIIRYVLMQSLSLMKEHLKEYEERPFTGAMQSQLLMNSSMLLKSSSGIDERCHHFYLLLENAKSAFKGLADNALLKSWEFTLASFSETKYQFAQWNLYESLGLRTDQAGGIGECIHQQIQSKLDVANRKVQEIQVDYEVVYSQVKSLESRIRSASTEKEVEWLKMEYQTRTGEFYFLQQQRDDAHHQAENLVDLYDTLYELYAELFKDYFQEVYDADMQEVISGPFDDSPAGFRLLYKHGRAQSSQWTLIHNRHEFIEALVSFFTATELQVFYKLEGKKIEKDLTDVISAIITYIKTDEFLISAFHRMAIAYQTPLIKNPLDHLEQIEKKPWVYTSGGVMATLVSCYYRVNGKPAVKEKWVESPIEALVFFADSLKQLPPNVIKPYLTGSRFGMLMNSPTHAFVLKPLSFPFFEAWQNDEFTFTFIRDHFVLPAEMFLERMMLNDEMLRFVIDRLSEKIPTDFLPRFRAIFGNMRGPMNPIFFREHLVDLLESDRGLHYGSRTILGTEEIDHLLHSMLPLTPLYQLKSRLQELLNQLPDLTQEDRDKMLGLFEEIQVSKPGEMFVSALELQNICKSLLCLTLNQTTSSVDYHYQISLASQRLGFAMPTPLIFADTNWTKDEFGFLINPGTGKLELWRIDYTGSFGFPMESWKQWLDGSQPDRKWGVYINPFEYGQY